MKRHDAVTVLREAAEKRTGELRYEKVTVAPLIREAAAAVVEGEGDDGSVATAIEALLLPEDQEATNGTGLYVDRAGKLALLDGLPPERASG